jgi:hypothetical protein
MYGIENNHKVGITLLVVIVSVESNIDYPKHTREITEPMTLEGRDLGIFEWENIYLKE